MLEESLIDFPGALVLVTHDRYLLDRVSTAVLGLDGQGHAGRFADYAPALPGAKRPVGVPPPTSTTSRPG